MSALRELLAIGLRLCEAMEAQTQAISALAASNEALVDEIAAGHGMEAEEDDGAGFDLAGNPIKAS